MGTNNSYSDCHLYETMPEDDINSSFMVRCSFCGKGCKMVRLPDNIGYDVELTIRRWADGDCSVDDMFERIKTEYRRIWNDLSGNVKPHLTNGGRPQYEYNYDKLAWERTESIDSEATTSGSAKTKPVERKP